MKKLKIGLVGCGNISGIYLKNLGSMFSGAQIVATADLIHERAVNAAKICGGKAMSNEELFNSDADIVLNLTTPDAHALINEQALQHGKHAYCEKPFACNMEDGERVMTLAKSKGLYIGCAPDTFMGEGIQTAKQAILDGRIGEVIGATAFMMSRGHEHWHPDPEFYYGREGGGPLFDMGPYYVTALMYLIGSIKRVTGISRASFPTRTILSSKKKGNIIEVQTPTHVTGTLQFENGSIANLITTFDVCASDLPRIEIYGSKGTLSVPDPNNFSGLLKIRGFNELRWKKIKMRSKKYAGNSRGLGVAEMVDAIRNGKPNIAQGERALHVLEAFTGILKSSETEQFYNMKTKVGEIGIFDESRTL